MTTDLHAHILPPGLTRALSERTTAPRIGDGALHMPIGAVPYDDGFGDLSSRLRAMDAAGIDRQLLSLPGLFGIDSLPLDQARDLCGLFNAGAAQAADTYPDRFAWLAAVPIADTDAAIATMRTCLDQGARGLILSCGAFTSEAMAETRAAPLLQALSDAGGGHVFVHPGRWPDDPAPPMQPYPDLAFARRQVHIQSEITDAAITLLYSSFLDRFAGVSVQIANLGGVLAMVSERIAEVAESRGLDAPEMKLRAGLWLDCASMGPHAIELAVSIFGADAIVLGTDMPIFGASQRMHAIATADITPAERARILDGGRALWA